MTDASECLIRAEGEWSNSRQTSTKIVKMFKSGAAELCNFVLQKLKKLSKTVLYVIGDG